MIPKRLRLAAKPGRERGTPSDVLLPCFDEAFFRGALADGGAVGKGLPGGQGLVVGCSGARSGDDVGARLWSVCTLGNGLLATLPSIFMGWRETDLGVDFRVRTKL